jgi:hypothetical protein
MTKVLQNCLKSELIAEIWRAKAPKKANLSRAAGFDQNFALLPALRKSDQVYRTDRSR